MMSLSLSLGLTAVVFKFIKWKSALALLPLFLLALLPPFLSWISISPLRGFNVHVRTMYQYFEPRRRVASRDSNPQAFLSIRKQGRALTRHWTLCRSLILAWGPPGVRAAFASASPRAHTHPQREKITYRIPKREKIT